MRFADSSGETAENRPSPPEPCAGDEAGAENPLPVLLLLLRLPLAKAPNELRPVLPKRMSAGLWLSGPRIGEAAPTPSAAAREAARVSAHVGGSSSSSVSDSPSKLPLLVPLDSKLLRRGDAPNRRA